MVDAIKVSFATSQALPLKNLEKSKGDSKARMQVLGFDDSVKEFAIALFSSKESSTKPKFNFR